MWNRKELKEQAKKVFKLNYWPAVVVGLVLSLLAGGSSGYPGGGSKNSDVSKPEQIKNAILSIDVTTLATIATVVITILSIVLIATVIGFAFATFLKNPLSIGCYRYFVLSGTEPAQSVGLSEMGFSFKEKRYGNVTVVMFLRSIYIFLWSLLLIVPGIIKAYEYRMIPYLLSENPQMDYTEAFEKSKKMMDGEKWNAFVLDLSFIGWIILGVCTCGILMIFYVTPYIEYTNAYLYLALRNKNTTAIE